MKLGIRGLTLVCLLVCSFANVAGAMLPPRGGNGGLPSPFYDGSIRDLVAGARLTFVGTVVEGRSLNYGEPSDTPCTQMAPYIQVKDSHGTQYFPLAGGWSFWEQFSGSQVMVDANVRIYQVYGKTWNDVRDVPVLDPVDGSAIEIVNGSSN